MPEDVPQVSAPPIERTVREDAEMEPQPLAEPVIQRSVRRLVIPERIFEPEKRKFKKKEKKNQHAEPKINRVYVGRQIGNNSIARMRNK